MTSERSFLYLTPGVFDKGGISRYCRYQLRAIRELLGPRAATVLSLLPPDERGFETPFGVDLAGPGLNPRGKATFVAAATAATLSYRPTVIWSAHAHLAPLAEGLAALVGATTILNVYGAEVWTDVTPLRAFAIRRADRLISDCHATLRHVLDSGLHAASATYVHWDCVDLAHFFPGDPVDVLHRYGVPPQPGDIFTVLTLARLSGADQHKGVDRLIDAISRVAPSRGVRLVVAGGGDQIPVLRALAAARGVGDRVHFLGYVTESDLPAVYRACDVFSLITNKGPGLGEGIPLTPLEAAACAKPILVGNQDGSREAADDGVSGFVLDPFDIDAIAARIERLADDRELRNAMGRAARVRIEREHSFECFRRRIDALLGEIGGVGARPAFSNDHSAATAASAGRA